MGTKRKYTDEEISTKQAKHYATVDDSDEELDNELDSDDDSGRQDLLNVDEFREGLDENDDNLRQTVSDVNVESVDNDPEIESVAMEAFDIKDDLKSGVFDKDGNFIRRASLEGDRLDSDEDEFWLKESIEKHDIAQVRTKDTTQKVNFTALEALYRLYFLSSVSSDQSNVLLTLANLNKLKKTFKKQNLTNVLPYISNAINLITICVDILERKGFENVYECNRKKFGVLIKEEAFGEDVLIDPLKSKIWMYRWVGKDKVYGPFSCYEMQHWKNTYFKDRVLVRIEDDEDTADNWLHISTIEFMKIKK